MYSTLPSQTVTYEQTLFDFSLHLLNQINLQESSGSATPAIAEGVAGQQPRCCGDDRVHRNCGHPRTMTVVVGADGGKA